MRASLLKFLFVGVQRFPALPGNWLIFFFPDQFSQAEGSILQFWIRG
jgi:hypothetical protein